MKCFELSIVVQAPPRSPRSILRFQENATKLDTFHLEPEEKQKHSSVCGGLGGRTSEVPVTADSGVSSGEAFAGGGFFLLLGVEADLKADFFNLDFVGLDAGAKKGKTGKGQGRKDRHGGDGGIMFA
jgi:hypothetical protein